MGDWMLDIAQLFMRTPSGNPSTLSCAGEAEFATVAVHPPSCFGLEQASQRRSVMARRGDR